MPFDDRWLTDLLARGEVRLVRGTAHLERIQEVQARSAQEDAHG
jgi:hypothetical protein